MNKDLINIHWIRWHGRRNDRMAQITIQNGDELIELGPLEWDECIDLAEHLREIANELDPQEDN